MQLDLLGSKQVIEWQEGKAAFLFASEGCWSELPRAVCALRHERDRAADREAEDARARVGGARLRFRHAGHGARLRRADGARRPRGPDAAGLQQDAQLPRVDGGARRRLGHDRRRWRHGGARRRRSRRRRDSCSPRRSPTRWCARRTSTRLRDVMITRAQRSRRRCGWCSTPRSPRRGRSTCRRSERRRHHRRQRHQVARRQRSRHVGLHRDQRHAVRELGDGSDGDARRHPRLAPRRRGRVGVRRRQRIARAAIGDGVEGRGVPERASEGQRGLSSVAAQSSGPGGDRQALRAPRIAAVVPRSPARTKIARGISPTCSPRR